MTRLRAVGALLLVAVVVLLGLGLKNALPRPAADFVVLHEAAVRFARGGDLYEAPREDPTRRYRYAPGTAAFLAPLAALDLDLAKRAWRCAIAAALLGAIAWLSSRSEGAARPWAVPLAFLLAVRWWIDELHLGQVNAAALLVVLLAFTLEDRRRPLWAGALLALPAALKVVPAIVALDWLGRRRWWQLAGLALGGLLVLALPLPWYGLGGTFSLHERWLSSEAESASTMIRHHGNQSLWAMAAAVQAPRSTALLASLALLATALAVPGIEARRVLLLAAMPLVSSYGWIQNFVFALPLVAWVLRTGGRAQVAALLAFAVVSPIVNYEVVGPVRERWLIEREVFGLAALGLFGVGAWVAFSAPPPCPDPSPSCAGSWARSAGSGPRRRGGARPSDR